METELEKLFNEYKLLFGLTNWQFVLSYDPNLEQSAKTLADPRYNRAQITIQSSLLAAPASWDEIIVHELIHVVFAMYDFFADNLGQDGSDNLFFVARENATSQMTQIVLRMLRKEENETSTNEIKTEKKRTP